MIHDLLAGGARMHSTRLNRDNRRTARARFGRLRLLIAVLGVSLASCSIALPDFNLPTGPFLLKGTFMQIDRFGQRPCFAFEGDNGIFYHLFQDVNLDDDLFDMATTVGVRSRLLMEIRSDLEVTCELGPVVEVLEVREIIGGG